MAEVMFRTPRTWCPWTLQILRQVGQRVFMVFDNKDSQAT